MVFGFFKKKKPKTDKAQNPAPEDKDTKNKKKTPEKEKESPKSNKNKHDSKPSKSNEDIIEDQWIYDSIVQFLQSPLWQIPIASFLDDNCIHFDDPKANKPELAGIHEEFKKLVHDLVENMLSELEIPQEKFLEVIRKGVEDTHYQKLFQQFFNAENYELFKKIMFKKYKELELQAMQELNEIDKLKVGYEADQIRRENEAEIHRVMREKEEADLEHAIALSLAYEEERKRLLQLEDDELQEALRISALEYSSFQQHEKERLKQEQERQRQLELAKEKEIQTAREREEKVREYEKKKQLELEEEREARELAIEREKQKQRERELEKERAIARADAEAENRRKSHEIHVEEDKEEEKSYINEHHGKIKLGPLKHVPKTALENTELTHSSIFPPLRGSVNFDASMEQGNIETEKKEIKLNPYGESLEERKKRLMAQRDLILAKKKAEREAELRSYEEKRAQANMTKAKKEAQESVSQEELKRRKEIYGKLKSQF